MLVFTVQQSESARLIHNPLFLGFPSHLSHHTALSRVPYSLFFNAESGVAGFETLHDARWVDSGKTLSIASP